MNRLILFTSLLLLLPLPVSAQMPDTCGQRMIPMSQTYQTYGGPNGNRYFENGQRETYTGLLYAKYDNGNFLTLQQLEDGQGNGFWIDFDPEGRMECKGTFKNNRVEGPVTFYYEDGSVKSEGQFRHWKQKIGPWVYYNRKGEVVFRITYTP